MAPWACLGLDLEQHLAQHAAEGGEVLGLHLVPNPLQATGHQARMRKPHGLNVCI